jgi:hypothetical protein
MKRRVRNEIESQGAMPTPRINVGALVVAGVILVVTAIAVILAQAGR